MNTNWLTLSKERRIEILNQATELTGLPSVAIEKDWWVTLALNASFSLPYSKNIVFKGGTSLSKGWNLIERFSEDIDLAIDRKFFGFEGEISKTQIKNLRKESCEFISTTFLDDLTKIFNEWEVIDECKLIAQPVKDSDKDPQVIEIHYNSVIDTSEYLPQRVLIEVSSRSLMEPIEAREINSILSDNFPQQGFATVPFAIATVLPQRTFLEKVFLLHEEFSQETEKIRIDRLSRHLYDLEKLMDTEHGIEALKNKKLYKNIVAHREKFNPLRGLGYANHISNKISIIPPDSVMKNYEMDYEAMTRFMIYGDSLKFDQLMKRILELQLRINEKD
ncbi:nucleotidyl transferase AbiEii/AbiGii toxin family protein [Flavobacterium psychrotolerans]|uniref:Nucleotidyl transferase AbiEii/AbiGii toxin family protein n=1 Tax=Flavobacterium psychrotolerans TaxID=2169410 RepID=A0A2U1JG88_9FLAO|nr:nucleotidyl transferase AbiEii/AbiGii toxin family protein [Flavobacterium psychrotolerans]PWA04019.1 nucleotidyl transferase AbiEii/AbiGii toxin family protein [Flavobacterium psychrotolerans]